MGIGMGALDQDEKYVVLFEIYGPASKSKGDRFDTALTDLMSEYGGLIKQTWHASKTAVDPIPSGTRAVSHPRHAAKGKKRRRRSKRSPATD